jgi:hypothetical protein
MISIRREIRRINRFTAESRVRHNSSHRSAQSHRERHQQIIRRLINKSSLRILGIKQESPETIVGIHHFDQALIVIPIQRNTMVNNIRSNLIDIRRETQTTFSSVRLNEVAGFVLRYRDGEEGEGRVFPDLGVGGRYFVLGRMGSKETCRREGGDAAEGGWDESCVYVVGDATAS